MWSLFAKIFFLPSRNGDLFLLEVFVRKQTNINILETSLLKNIILFLLFQPENKTGLSTVMLLHFFNIEKYCKRSILIFLSFAEGNGLPFCQQKRIWDFRYFSLRGYCLTNTIVPTQGTVLLCSCSQRWCKILHPLEYTCIFAAALHTHHSHCCIVWGRWTIKCQNYAEMRMSCFLS